MSRYHSPNDEREIDSPHFTRACTRHPFQFQRFSSNVNAHKFSFFVRTVPVWNALYMRTMLPRFTQVFVILYFIVDLFIDLFIIF